MTEKGMFVAEFVAMRELECQACDRPIKRGDPCIWREDDGFYHLSCAETKGLRPSPPKRDEEHS